MKIGIDARLLSRPLTGIGRYTFELTRSLILLEQITLYLYSPARILDDCRLKLNGSKVRTMNLEAGLLRQAWTETLLPIWACHDKVDVFWGPAHRLPRWLPRKAARVVTIHDLVWKYVPNTMRPLSRLLEKIQMPLAIKDADQIVTVSRATAGAIVEEFKVDPGKLSVITPGASRALFPPDKKQLFELEINQPYFLFVGTLEPRKNLENLLTAYANLPESVKAQALLVIAGGKGWGGVDLKRTVARLDMGKFVRLLGYVDEQTLSALYANAIFIAMPSLYEGFGLPLVEGMAYGKPVLTSNISSMPEVAGDAGVFVEPQDVGAITSGLEQMITHPELRKKLGARAKKNAVRYNWNESVRQLVAVFEKAVSGRRSRNL